jgi:hypothetical protein
MGNGITTGRGSAARDLRPHYVYQFWGQSTCLYIGMTASPSGRIATHARSSWWRKVVRIEAEVHPDRLSAMEAEARLIAEHEPSYNFYHAEASAGSRSGGPQGHTVWRKADVIAVEA